MTLLAPTDELRGASKASWPRGSPVVKWTQCRCDHVVFITLCALYLLFRLATITQKVYILLEVEYL